MIFFPGLLEKGVKDKCVTEVKNTDQYKNCGTKWVLE